MRRRSAAEHSRADQCYSTETIPRPLPSRKTGERGRYKTVAGGVTMPAAAATISQAADLVQPLGHFTLGLAMASLPVGLVLACIWFFSTAKRRVLGYFAVAALLIAAFSGGLSYKQWTTPDGERFGVAGANIRLVREVQGRLHLIERSQVEIRQGRERIDPTAQTVDRTAMSIDQSAQRTANGVEAVPQRTGNPVEGTAAQRITIDQLRSMVQERRSTGRPVVKAAPLPLQPGGESAGYVQARVSFSLFTAPAGGMLMKVFGIDNFFFPLRLPPTAAIDRACLDDNRTQLQVALCEGLVTLEGDPADPMLRIYPALGFPAVALDEVRVREAGQAR